MLDNKKGPTRLHLTQKTFKSEAFAKRLGKALISFADTDFGSATAEVLGIAVLDTVEEKAFELILTALEYACIGILKDDGEHQKMLNAVSGLHIESKVLNDRFKSNLKDIELSIDHSFFAQPHKSQFIKALVSLYEKWLHKQVGFTNAQSQSLAALLPLKFLYELTQLWSNKPIYYKEIEDFFNNPFFQAIHDEHKKTAYHYELKNYYSQPVFGSPEMTLADIYVEPNFKVYGKAYQTGAFYSDSDGFALNQYEGNLHNYILRLFNNEMPLKLRAERSGFTILLGQPGQGKTSFCLRCMYDLLSEDSFNDNLYFVRLRYIKNVKDAINNPLESIRKHIANSAFQSDIPIPLEDLNHAILILDGLDELYMHQGLTNADIKNLVKSLSHELNSYQSLKILLTTRYNYLNINELSGEKYLILKIDELSENQQLKWLEKYKAIYTGCDIKASLIETINKSEEQRYEGIKELINQPILLQMIARSGLDVTKDSNRAKIYQTLFDNIINRKWSKDGQLEKYEQVTEKDLRGFLQTIALAIYQSDFEYIRRNEFESHELLHKSKDRFLKKTNNQLPLDDALKDILVSFYFKNRQKSPEDKDDKDRHNDYAIEFLHKSLQEYLVAEKIWNFFKTSFTRKDTDNEFFIDDWKVALKEIYPIISSKIISYEITDYLIEIIQNDMDKVAKDELAKRLESFLPALIKRDFLYQFDLSKEYSPFDRGLSTFYAYWTVLSHLRGRNIINKESQSRFIFILSALINLVGSLKINLYETNLHETNLVGANLSGINLSGANLLGANLSRANLSGANLSGANLSRANLSGANLSGANLSGANLVEANLTGADLLETNLSRANLSGANLSRANLVEANLTEVNLVEANLVSANLVNANLYRADLHKSNLYGANLKSTNLINADLTSTNLINVHLTNAKVTNADLTNADLVGANLKNVDLIDAIGLEKND